jgi:hypothetical protein
MPMIKVQLDEGFLHLFHELHALVLWQIHVARFKQLQFAVSGTELIVLANYQPHVSLPPATKPG